MKKYVISAALFLELDLIKMMVLENNDIVLRAGGATLDEIESIVNFILSIDNSSKINILVGIQLYPTPINELHIASISSLREYFKNTNITFGLADHIDGDLRNSAWNNFKTICANCQRIMTMEEFRWRQGDLMPDN